MVQFVQLINVNKHKMLLLGHFWESDKSLS